MPQLPNSCPICGAEMRFRASRRITPNLDRTIPAAGYVQGNVRWICASCNSVKSDRIINDDELRLEIGRRLNP